MRKIARFSLAALVALAGCAGAKSASPEAETPEITISGVKNGNVMHVVVQETLQRGYWITYKDENRVVFSKHTGSPSTAYPYSQDYRNEPQARLTFQLDESPRGVHVAAQSEVVANPGALVEQSLRKNDWQSLQDARSILKSTFAAFSPKKQK